MPQSEGSFIRWQQVTIRQLGFANNLFLTFATASLGFALSLIKDKDFQLGCWARCFLDFSLLGFMASIALGTFCVLNRLWDFRITAQIARLREESTDSKEPDGIQGMRRESNKLGKRTWRLFYWQFVAFGVGVAMFVVAFAVAYHTKLF